MRTEAAIIRYNAAVDNSILRSKIYSEHIDYPFNKLAENTIHVYKFYYFDYDLLEVQNEVVAHMLMNMHKFDPTRGSKAFSYFSIVAKNYLILHNNKNYKNSKIHDGVEVLDYSPSSGGSASILRKEESARFFADFIEDMLEYWEENMHTIFPKRKDLDIVDSVLELFRIRENIEIFNKKALYLLVRERAGVKTQQITKIVNIMKKHNSRLMQEFHRTGTIDKKGEIFTY